MKYLDDKKQINYNLMNNHLWIIEQQGMRHFFLSHNALKQKE